jgi:hypothetical protein
METRHLYWIFIGPSFAVYAKYDVTLKHTLQWVYMLIHLFENAFTFLQLPADLIHRIDCRAGSGVLTCSNHSQHVYRRWTALILYFFKYFIFKHINWHHMGTTVTVLFDTLPIFHAGVGTGKWATPSPPQPLPTCAPVCNVGSDLS